MPAQIRNVGESTAAFATALRAGLGHMDCRCDSVGRTTGVPLIAADLPQHPSRQSRANSGHRGPFSNAGPRCYCNGGVARGRAEDPRGEHSAYLCRQIPRPMLSTIGVLCSRPAPQWSRGRLLANKR